MTLNVIDFQTNGLLILASLKFTTSQLSRRQTLAALVRALNKPPIPLPTPKLPPPPLPPGPPRGAGRQQLLLPGPVQCRGQERGGGAAPGRAAPELPADPGLLLHGPPQHERGGPVPPHVHRRLPPDPADHGEGNRVLSQGKRRLGTDGGWGGVW